MKDIQPIWDKAKKTLKFVWRHILTLYILTVILRAILAGHVEIVNACIYLAGAIFLDWAKQFVKSRPSHVYDNSHSRLVDPRHDISVPLHRRQWWNPGIMGTGAYDLNRGGIKWDK